jgi:NAD(P)H-hydrate epimerase
MPAESRGLDVPSVTSDQMREVDRLMVEEYGILLVQMMENAGRGLAQLARRLFLDGDPRGRQVLVLAGTGGNGGGGLVCARRLHDWGANVQVYITAPAARFTGVPRHQLAILERTDVPLEVADSEVELPPADIIVDALVGYGLSGPLRGASAILVQSANSHPAPVLALDIPSGMDATTGAVHEPCIRATATLTLALPKKGLRAPPARDLVGELYLGDIGVPPGLYAREPFALDIGPVFAKNDIVRLS